ncbi:MAG: ATP-binding protein [Alphaproteobacteria bacterium]|nr:ATP-binding protein [Alphaproteobacteria bacterium]
MKTIPSLIVSALVFCAVVGVTYILHRSETQRQAVLAARDLRADVNLLAGRLQQSVNHKLQLTRGLAAFVHSQPDFTEEDFERFANALSGDQNGIRSLQLAPDGVITYITNKAENDSVLGHDLLRDPKRGHLVHDAIDKRKYVIAGPINLLQGGVAIIARQPIFVLDPVDGEIFWGFATALLDPNILMRESGIEEGLPGVTLALRGKDALGADGAVFYGDPAVFQAAVVEIPVTLAAGSWSLAAAWSQSGSRFGGWLSWLWIGGIFVAIVLGAWLFNILRRPEVMRIAVDQATRDVQESRQRLTDFAAASSDWFWEMDENLRFSFFSGRFKEVTGVEPETLLGKTREETGIPNVDPSQWKRHLEALHNRQPFRTFIHPRELPEGGTVWLSINGIPYYDQAGRFRGFRGTGNEITELVEAQKIAEQARQEAEVANREKSAFLANMSHELRTPLNAIIGFSETMLAQIFGPLGSAQYREQAQAIHQSGHHLLDLVNDILDVAKIEADAYELNPEPFDLDDEIDATFRIIQAAADRDGIELAKQVPADLPNVIVDKRAMKQILLNLVSNAVKFTPEGGAVRVGASASGYDLTICVEDTGVGIAAQDIPNLTKPFTQGSQKQAYIKGNGTGLGLSIVASLVRLHQGTLGIDSEVGEGTRVKVVLPGVVRNVRCPIAS